MPRTYSLLATLALAGAGVVALPATEAAAATVSDAWTNASRYAPGQEAVVTARVDGSGPVNFKLTHLGDVVAQGTVSAGGSGEVTWRVTPPHTDFTGYLVEIEAGTTRTQTAIDVSSTWTRFPRMGFLAHYGTGISGAEAEGDIAELSQRYHINSLQYYDWLWKHEKPVKHDGSGVASTWTAWSGDTISSQTVRDYIASGHDRGVAAMPYQMSYAALNDYDQSQVSPDWRLFKGNGQEWTYPMLPGQVLKLMNPQNTGWQNYIIGQYTDSVASMGFDGAHLDQIGYWEEMYDINGNRVDRPAGFAQLTDRARQALPAGRNAVGFNAVDGYGDAELARSSADYLYTELWSNYETNASVRDYLERQRVASGGKPHITPAYMNRPNTPEGTPNSNTVFDTTSVQLANAMFAANGAHHLELGPNDHMLNTEYFLNQDKTMSAELRAWEKTYYDVITAYENLFYGPDLHTATNTVEIAGQPTSTTGAGNAIWTNVMRNNGTDVIHLINLIGNDDKWRDAGTQTPPTLTDLPVKYYLGDQDMPPSIHLASPDRDGGRSTELAFTTGTDSGGRYVSFTVPELKNWDFIYFDRTADPDPTTGQHLVNTNGKCAEIAGGDTANGTPVQQATCTTAARQSFTLSGGELRVLGKCVDTVGGATANGTPAHLWDCGGFPSQQWVHQSDGTLKNVASGRCLDIDQQSTADGAALHLWDCGGWASQQWTFAS
ncbi:glycoside hydrolase family 66 protein [Streptomyces sp. NBC_01803]|uniref:glycoside hydrolase family 66 protein n=1 Tax=Streptomyces sp. NBC_01803 TaxID=2975946 RepID=UPI002DD8F113|nr:glycoside hydrolase family 66 protein [Streptomyces sp. NBC_01803]WSA43729.1 RICIN domain-containing protein [Streptomyces sp. NBC_01803]